MAWLIFWTYLLRENDGRAQRWAVSKHCGWRQHVGHSFRSATKKPAEDSWPDNQLIFIEWLLHIWQNSTHGPGCQKLGFSHKKETKSMRLVVEGLDMGQITKAGIQLVTGSQSRNPTPCRIMQEYNWTS